MIYSEQERRIYQCPLTQQFYDPLAAKRAMLAAAGGAARFNEAVRDHAGQDEAKALAAEGLLVTAGRAALKLPAVDPKTGAGTTDAVVIEALTAFTRWLAGKGGTARGGPNAAPCTDCPPGP